jgi:hypothetical protein
VVGTDYRKKRGLCGSAFFCSDYRSDPSAPPTLQHAGLELTKFHPRRGKLITRSDWSPEAAYLIFDARPDAFLIGHDKADRGNFIFSALGRSFVTHGSFRQFVQSKDHSLVHIDGMGQAYKAPSVKFLSWSDDGTRVTGRADLKYAYDWQWTPPWPKQGQPFPAPWEPETHDPRELGWPDDPEWLPHTLHNTPDIGYQGSWMWRRPHQPVERAFRTATLVRGDRPYVLIDDDIRKDATIHRYDWYLHIADDLVIRSKSGRDIILGTAQDKPGAPRLLVRVLRAIGADGTTPGALDVKQENYTNGVDKWKKVIAGNRLIIGVDSIEPKFRIALVPHRAGDDLSAPALPKD